MPLYLPTEELFDRCAELRRQRTTAKHPGRPSQRFVLKSIARCERCQGCTYGQTSGRKGMPRYYCSTRRKREGCDQPLAPAVPIEQQLAEFIAAFTPSPELRDEIMARLVIDEPTDADTDRQRRTLKERRKRLRDLYEMGDIEKAEYRAKCAEIDVALDGMAPGPTADLDGARAVLEDFGRFWEAEADPVKRRELVGQLFERVWIDECSRRSSSCAPAGALIGPQTTTPPLVEAARLKVRERRGSNPGSTPRRDRGPCRMILGLDTRPMRQSRGHA